MPDIIRKGRGGRTGGTVSRSVVMPFAETHDFVARKHLLHPRNVTDLAASQFVSSGVFLPMQHFRDSLVTYHQVIRDACKKHTHTRGVTNAKLNLSLTKYRVG